MARSLPEGSVWLSTPVVTVADRGDHVEVSTERETLRAPFVISTIPFAAMREKVRLEGPPDDENRRLRSDAISGLS